MIALRAFLRSIILFLRRIGSIKSANDEALPKWVMDSEVLVRFIFNSSEYRKSDLTVKPKAFMPPKNGKWSVTRRGNLEECAIWSIGQSVASARQQALHGKGEILAAAVRWTGLKVEPAPLQKNPNHANVVGWPQEKDRLMSVAQQLAAAMSPIKKPI
jgi:hypothetical protein